MKIEKEKSIVKEKKIRILPTGITVGKAIRNMIEEKNARDSFLIGDMGEVVRKYETWKEILPNVRPFYTVRCNDSPIVLRTLSALGSVFNCYSKAEMERLIDYGVGSDGMVFGAPLKTGSQIESASSLGVDLLAFECAGELRKLKAYHRNPKLILRLKTPFEKEFDLETDEENDSAGGISDEQRRRTTEMVNRETSRKIDRINAQLTSVLTCASQLGLDVVGFSLDSLPSGGGEEGLVEGWIRGIVGLAETLGHGIGFLDLGSGLKETSDLEKISQLASRLSSLPVTLTADCGPYLVSSGFSLSTRIQGSRVKREEREEGAQRQVLYLSEGVYGYVFGKLLTGDKLGQDSRPKPLLVSSKSLVPTWRSTDVIGPTCDTLDVIEENRSLPPLETGDWIKFDSIGDFYVPTGLTADDPGSPEGPAVHYFIEEKEWFRIKGLHPDLLDLFEEGEEKEKKGQRGGVKGRKKSSFGGRVGRNNPSQKRRGSSAGVEEGGTKGADRSRRRTISPDPSRKDPKRRD